MRRQNLRVFLFLFLLTALAGLVIGYRDIDLPGDQLDRGGTGPLGLVLGLDLRGGAHLVYQAQRPVKMDITFAQPVEEESLRKALNEIGLGASQVTSSTKQNFVIELPGLAPDKVDGLIQELSSKTSAISSSSQTREDRTHIELRLKPEPSKDRIKETASGLGYADAEVETLASQFFAITKLPKDINADAEKALKDALGQHYPVQTFQLVDSQANADQKEAYVIFQPIPVEGTVQGTLEELKHTRAPVLTEDGRTFTTAIEALDADGQAKLVTDLNGKMPAIEEVKTSIVEAAILDLTFQTGVDQGTLESTLTDLNFANALVTSAKGTNYSVDLAVLPVERDLTIEGEIAGKTAPMAPGGFRFQRDEATTERMEGVVDTIERRVDAFGVAEPVVQRLGDDRIIVQLPGIEDTHIEVGFSAAITRDALEQKLEELGFSKNSVESIPGLAIPNSARIIVAGLTEENSEKVRNAMVEKFGALQDYSFSQPGNSIQVVFSQQVSTTDLRALLSDQGLTNPIINQAQSTSFRVRIPTQTASEQAKLRSDLAALGLVVGFKVTGGVEQAKQLIGQTAQLVIKERTCLDQACTQFTDKEAVGRSGESLTGDRLVNVFAGTHPTTGVPIVNFVFDNTGTRIFREFTTRIAGNDSKCVAHVLDGESIVCPVVRQPIVNGSGFIEGQDFTFDRVKTLSIQLQSGSLPVSLALVRETTVESILGDETLKASLKAGALGLALVAFYMIVYYRVAGLMASAALIVYALMALAIFKMVPITLTLSGIAGIILSVGMAVDANIVIFERLKEELRAGRSLLSAMEIGFRRGWPAIRDGNIATFISCAILFFFGRELGEPKITGFAITLAVGTALSMFTAITVTRNFMNLMVFTPMGRRLNLFTPESLARPAPVPTAARGGEK